MNKKMLFIPALLLFLLTPLGAQISSWSPPKEVFWGSFITANLTSAYSIGVATPRSALTVSRFQMFLNTAPVGCATNAVVWLLDSTSSATLTQLTTVDSQQVYDSGPISVVVPAGHVLRIRIGTAAAGCTTSPNNANVTVQYY